MKNFKQIFTTLALALFATATFAQVKVGDNPTTINADAVLEMESTNKGLLLPRVALTGTANTAPMSAHVAGMAVYNTATAADVTPGYYINDGTQWVRVAASAVTASNGLTATAGNITLGGALTGPTVITDVNSLDFQGNSPLGFVRFANLSEDGRQITKFESGANNAVEIRTHGANYNEILWGTQMGGTALFGANTDFVVASGGNMTLAAIDSLRIGNPTVPVEHIAITAGTPTTADASVPENLVSLYKPGTAAVSFGSGGTIAIGKHTGGTNNSFSSMQFRLAHLLETDLVDVMTLQSNGNVGIGTTTPAAKLDVNGNGIFNTTPFDQNANAGANVLSLTSPGVGGSSFGSVAHLAVGKDAASQNSKTTLSFRLADLTESDLYEVMKLNRTNATINTYPFDQNANAGANVLTLTSPGVGGSSFGSVAHLAVGKDAGQNSNTTLSFRLAGLTESDLYEVMKLNRTNATINTTPFDQNANAGANLLTLNSPGVAGSSFGSVAHLAVGKAAGQNSNTTLSFRLAGLTESDLVEVMKLQANGFVGIGTTAPTSMLQVVGLPIHADNAAALAAGLTAGAFYHNGDGIVRVVF